MCKNKPVCTLSPICSSDIVTFLPFSNITLAMDGKQPDFFSIKNTVMLHVISINKYNRYINVSHFWLTFC